MGIYCRLQLTKILHNSHWRTHKWDCIARFVILGKGSELKSFYCILRRPALTWDPLDIATVSPMILTSDLLLFTWPTPPTTRRLRLWLLPWGRPRLLRTLTAGPRLHPPWSSDSLRQTQEHGPPPLLAIWKGEDWAVQINITLLSTYVSFIN